MEKWLQLLSGGLAGAVWGALVALLGSRVTLSALRRNDANAVLLSVLTRTVLDAAALAAVWLLRGVLPLRWEAVLVGTALGLSATGIGVNVHFSRRSRERNHSGGE